MNFSDKFAALFPARGSVGILFQNASPIASKCPDISPFFDDDSCMRRLPLHNEVRQTSTHFARAPCRTVPAIAHFAGHSEPVGNAPGPHSVPRGTALRSSALVPCLSDLTSEIQDTPLRYRVYYSKRFQKKQVFFLCIDFRFRIILQKQPIKPQKIPIYSS